MAPASAVLLLGVIGVGSTAGRFFLGGLADRMGRQRSLLMMFTGMAVALTVWVIATNLWSLAAFAFVYGVFYGGWVAVLPAVPVPWTSFPVARLNMNCDGGTAGAEAGFWMGRMPPGASAVSRCKLMIGAAPFSRICWMQAPRPRHKSC